MANILSNVNIASGEIVKACHVTQSINAFTGVEAYDISLSGSFNMTGSINGQPLIINPLTASYAITASYAEANGTFPYTGDATINGSLGVTGLSLFEGPIAGLFNTAIGDSTLISNIDGYNNVAIGFRCLENNTSGYNNISIGMMNLRHNEDGYNNIVIGSNSSPFATNADNHILIGNNNLSRGGSNIVIGNDNNTSGSNSIFLGHQITGSDEDNQLYIGSVAYPIGTLLTGSSWTAIINGIPVAFKLI